MMMREEKDLMSKWIRVEMIRLFRGEEGTEVVEWTLVAGLIVAIAAATFLAIGQDVDAVFTAIEANTQQAADNVQ